MKSMRSNAFTHTVREIRVRRIKVRVVYLHEVIAVFIVPERMSPVWIKALPFGNRQLHVRYEGIGIFQSLMYLMTMNHQMRCLRETSYALCRKRPRSRWYQPCTSLMYRWVTV